MDEKEQEEIKRKAEEEAKKKAEVSVKPEDAGSKSETDIKVEQLNADTERIKKAIAENENAKAKRELGGMSEAGQAPVKKDPAKEMADEMVNAFN